MQYLFVILLTFPLLALGFSPDKISSRIPPDKTWEIKEQQGLEAIFSQEFSYMAAGSQSYAFISADGRYVMKFFRMKHYAPRFVDFFRPGRVKKKRENREALFCAYKLGFEKMRKDAGLIYLHLSKTEHFKKKIVVRDREGKACSIDLDQTEFVVQEKAEPIFAYLQRAGSRQEEAIARVMELIDRRSEQGIFDRDGGVSQNFGFVGDRPVQMDVGRIYEGEGSKEKEHERVLKKIREKLVSSEI